MIESTITAELAGGRLDTVVAAIAGISRSAAEIVIRAGGVRVDAAVVEQKSLRVQEGSRIAIDASAGQIEAETFRASDAPELPIRFEDEHLLVVAKPAGLVVHPAPGHHGPTMVDALRPKAPAGGDPERPGIVHRLDRDTSGLLVVARSEQVHAELSAMLKRREITRVYVSLVDGAIEQDSLTIDAPVGRDPRQRTRMAVVAEGRDAVTDLDVSERLGAHTLVRVTLRTGRTHQIRVHLSAIGHPVSGDVTYRASQRLARQLGLGRPFLHSSELRFVHPVTAKAVVVEEDLPEDLVSALARAGEMLEPEPSGPPVPPHRREGSPHLEPPDQA